MAKNNFHQPTTAHPGAWENFWLPFLVAIGLWVFDFYLTPGVFALTLLYLVLLIYLSFRLTARMVAVWTGILATVILIISLLPISEGVTDPALKPYIRLAVFLTGGAMAMLLATSRRRLEIGHESLFHVISGLPLPVIVSDISGNILLLNEQARQVLKNHSDELAGLSYFSTFVSPHDQGKTIATYISYFDPTHVGTIATVLQTRGEPALSLHAAITVVDVGKHRYAITIVERVEHAAADA